MAVIVLHTTDAVSLLMYALILDRRGGNVPRADLRTAAGSAEVTTSNAIRATIAAVMDGAASISTIGVITSVRRDWRGSLEAESGLRR